jgi:hypothetical protein
MDRHSSWDHNSGLLLLKQIVGHKLRNDSFSGLDPGIPEIHALPFSSIPDLLSPMIQELFISSKLF